MSDATKSPTPLPPGLSLGRRNESIETLVTRSSKSRLRVATGGLEITEIELKSDETLTLIPPDGAEEVLTESLYLLAGELSFAALRHLAALKPGDTLVADALTEPVTLVADGAVTMLYISSRPTFEAMSRDMRELMALAVQVEEKDGYTADHCARLQRLSDATARELTLSDQQLYLLSYGSYLHDVGKVRVPLEILQKPAKLTTEEYEVIKRHPVFGRELLDPTSMREAGRLVEQHHERLDGSGYPHGLAGDEVLVGAYIVAVADTFDAMTTDRPYRKALSREVAFEELSKFAGVHYPREVVKAFFSAVPRVERDDAGE